MCLSSLQNTAKEVEEEKQQSLTEEEVKAKIEAYNSQVTENGMNLVSILCVVYAFYNFLETFGITVGNPDAV